MIDSKSYLYDFLEEQKSRATQDATLTMSLSAARLSFQDGETAYMSINNNSKTRGFPSRDCSGFGYVMGKQI